MAGAMTFADIVDLVDRLPLDDKESLIDVLRRRAAEQRRARIVREVAASEREYLAGKARSASPDEIMREILR